MQTPDYERAAIMALETLIRFDVHNAPINPLPMLQSLENVSLVSFTQMSDNIGVRRQDLMKTFRYTPDAFSSVNVEDGKLQYIVAYNQKLGEGNHSLHCALARELSHIILGHDGTLPFDVRKAEAVAFHHHLLCPRPLIHAIQAAGIRITNVTLNFLTGCNEQCLASLRKMPPVHVPADLNRAVFEQFRDYILNFFEFHRTIATKDVSGLADFGSYMDGYKE